MIYSLFAQHRKKSGDPVFVFWDYKCLNYGQNWEKGFLKALLSSKLIILLISMKVKVFNDLVDVLTIIFFKRLLKELLGKLKINKIMFWSSIQK